MPEKPIENQVNVLTTENVWFEIETENVTECLDRRIDGLRSGVGNDVPGTTKMQARFLNTASINKKAVVRESQLPFFVLDNPGLIRTGVTITEFWEIRPGWATIMDYSTVNDCQVLAVAEGMSPWLTSLTTTNAYATFF